MYLPILFSDFIAPEPYYMPRTDSFYQTEGEYVIKLAVPGIEKDQLKVELTGDTLLVSFSNAGDAGNKAGYSRRSYFMKHEIKRDEIKASLRNGILTITVPKAIPPEPEHKLIEIS